MTGRPADGPDVLAADYGAAPANLGRIALPDWHEFMHYLYLPVRLPTHDGGGNDGYAALPERLAFLDSLIYRAIDDARATVSHLGDPYVYVSTRRGFASPGNPLNRPGWHCDDFGGTDLNYIWCDVYPTRFLTCPTPLPIPDDDDESMSVMQRLAHPLSGWAHGQTVVAPEPGRLLRLTPHVIHTTPVIPPPGGMRSFVKVSISTHRYNLLGNSHNYLLDYDWPMVDRAILRNQPSRRNRDYHLDDTGAARDRRTREETRS